MKRGIVLLAFATLAGCTHYAFLPQKVDSNSGPWKGESFYKSEGYVIYEPKPVLLASCTEADSKLSYKYEIQYVPDYTRPYQVKFQQGLGSSESTFTVNQGWMLASSTNKVTMSDGVVTGILDAALASVQFAKTGDDDDDGAAATPPTCKFKALICDLTKPPAASEEGCKSLGIGKGTLLNR